MPSKTKTHCCKNYFHNKIFPRYAAITSRNIVSDYTVHKLKSEEFNSSRRPRYWSCIPASTKQIVRHFLKEFPKHQISVHKFKSEEFSSSFRQKYWSSIPASTKQIFRDFLKEGPKHQICVNIHPFCVFNIRNEKGHGKINILSSRTTFHTTFRDCKVLSSTFVTGRRVNRSVKKKDYKQYRCFVYNAK